MNNKKEYNKNYSKKWREINKEYIKEYRKITKKHRYEKNKEWVKRNKEKRFLQQKAWRERNKEKLKKQRIDNIDRINEKRRERRKKEENRAKHRIYVKNKRNTDINFKITGQLRSRVYSSIIKQKGLKGNKTLVLLGCSIEQVKMHLENLFKTGMSWKNYGKFGWHIDHIKPCASFDLTDPEQQKQCFHYTNLQPLWWWENLKKSDKII